MILINSTYKVTLSTPIGRKEGIIKFEDENGVLNGTIRAMGSDSPFKGGKLVGNSFEISGILRAGFLKFKYTAAGIIDGNTLKATAKTDSGTFQISGFRVM